jgi:hypothetical protein
MFVFPVDEAELLLVGLARGEEDSSVNIMIIGSIRAYCGRRTKCRSTWQRGGQGGPA